MKALSKGALPSAKGRLLTIRRHYRDNSRILANSFSQLLKHLHDGRSDTLELFIDGMQVTRRLEHIEVPVERNLVANLRLVVVNPCIRRMRQYLTLKIGLNLIGQRHIFSITERSISLRHALLLAFQNNHDVPVLIAHGTLNSNSRVAKFVVLKHT